MNWHLQDAKNNFSKVVQKARTEGPQTVTLRGERAAVVISAEEYDRLAGKRRRSSIIFFLHRNGRRRCMKRLIAVRKRCFATSTSECT